MPLAKFSLIGVTVRAPLISTKAGEAIQIYKRIIKKVGRPGWAGCLPVVEVLMEEEGRSNVGPGILRKKARPLCVGICHFATSAPTTS